MAFSATAVAVFGVYFKLQSFVFMPVFGLNNGMVPIIAYNYGAGHRDRVIKTIKHSVAYGVGIMFVGLLAMHIFPAQLMRMFDAEDQVHSVSHKGSDRLYHNRRCSHLINLSNELGIRTEAFHGNIQFFIKFQIK